MGSDWIGDAITGDRLERMRRARWRYEYAQLVALTLAITGAAIMVRLVLGA